MRGKQLVIEREDLRPVGLPVCGRVGVDGIDRRLDLVGAGNVGAQAVAHQPLRFGDHGSVPRLSVLVGQEHEIDAAGGARRGAGVREQHQREQPSGFVFVGRQFGHESS